MDIAKYIGAYLLKNGFCYLHGLGNMEIKKNRATHDGQTLQAPTFEVIVTPGGSIDDNLANYIATAEQISISKAANGLREFSIQARKELAEGKEVIIPNIGKFIEKNGKIGFITDSHFSYAPPGIPIVKNSKQLEEQKQKPAHKPSYPPPAKADSINWSMVILVAVLVLIISGAIYAVYYYNNQQAAPQEVEIIDTPVQAPAPIALPDSAASFVDSAATDTSAVNSIVDTNAITTFKMVIGNYHSQKGAERRVEMLKLNGNKVEMVSKDTANYYVVAQIGCRIVDTTRVKDSLKAWFGYKEVMIYKP